MNRGNVSTNNTNVKQDMVNIELPRQIADILKNPRNFSNLDYTYFELVTHDKVLDALSWFLGEPIEQKRIFDELLFEYMTGLSLADDNFIDSERVLFLRRLNDLLIGALDFIYTRTKEGGNHD